MNDLSLTRPKSQPKLFSPVDWHSENNQREKISSEQFILPSAVALLVLFVFGLLSSLQVARFSKAKELLGLSLLVGGRTRALIVSKMFPFPTFMAYSVSMKVSISSLCVSSDS